MMGCQTIGENDARTTVRYPDRVNPKTGRVMQYDVPSNPSRGTGLGLSLSYDIVTQGHRGTLAVEGMGGDGATFVITLPA